MSSCQSPLYIEKQAAESSQQWAGESHIPSFLTVIQLECAWDIYQDWREVCDRGEEKLKISLVKKKMWAYLRITFLLGLFFMMVLFMGKFLFKAASLHTSTFKDPVVEFLSFLPSWNHHKFWKEIKIRIPRVILT